MSRMVHTEGLVDKYDVTQAVLRIRLRRWASARWSCLGGTPGYAFLYSTTL
jgi:hypothetical protein